jgi:hypothetical protein
MGDGDGGGVQHLMALPQLTIGALARKTIYSHSTLEIYSAANVTISVIRCSCTSMYTPAVAALWRAWPLRFSTSQHFRRLYISKLEQLYRNARAQRKVI